MGYFDAFTSSLFRFDTSGNRVYAPLGRWGSVCVVSDTDAPRIERIWRRFYQGMLGILLILGIAWHWTWKLLLLAPVASLAAVGLAFFVSRSLPRSSTSWRDLQPVTRGQAYTQNARAIGRPVLRIMLGITLFMVIVGIVGTFIAPTPMLWFSIAFFSLCSLSFWTQLKRLK